MVKRLLPALVGHLKQISFGRTRLDRDLILNRSFIILAVLIGQLLTACIPEPLTVIPAAAASISTPPSLPPTPAVTPLPTRPIYQPGQLVDYLAQTGDTLPALAYRFNTTENEIRTANPNIPSDVTTMPHGMPMKIPIYYQPFWGSPYEILPDSLFVNGPEQRGFDPVAFVNSQPGWFKDYEFFTGEAPHRGGELVAQIAIDYSISPRLLLALIEFQTGALSQAQTPNPEVEYPLGYRDYNSKGIYRQLLWAASQLNQGFYLWREGQLKEFDLLDGRQQRLDPWINATTASLQFFFSRIYTAEIYNHAIHGEGLALTYKNLFGDPWLNVDPHIPVNLRQPALLLPFPSGHTWAFTGGPHTGWGNGEPLSAVDFAPPTVLGGCSVTSEYATALADGEIVRAGQSIAVLDLDGDHDERTGWVIFYLHLASEGMIANGTTVLAGDPIGHPSCEGGRATGTHIHIARKYNGEWIPADGVLAFNLEGWTVGRGSSIYEGFLTRGTNTIRACTCSDHSSQVTARE